MGKLIVSENITLDGVVQDPTGEEGFEHGGWWARVSSNDRQAFAAAALDEARVATALLFGRRSYEFFAARWPSRSGELADRLNSLPKYVVSSSLANPDWNNSTTLKGDAVTEVSRLKQQLSGQVVVLASRQLVQTLVAHDLVDELRLLVYPVVLGSGKRLFGETNQKLSLHLVNNRTLGDSLAHMTYELIKPQSNSR